MNFIDLKAQYENIKEEVNNNLQEVLESSRYIGGSMVKELENKLAKYVGRKHCISCGNGTDAIQLAFMALGIGRGDAFFCPNMTFIASAEPGMLLGATPVLCEIDEKSYNICSKSLEEQIIKVIEEGKLNPKAVVVVDFLGNPADYDELTKICEKYNLYLIEDAAQGISGTYKGKRCGSFGVISTTSFFPSKPLGCYGDGGAIFTDDDNLAEILNSLKVHGKGEHKYDNVRVGVNSRLDSIQAAVLLAKFDVLEDELKRRQEVANRYIDTLSLYIKTPYVDSDNVSSYAQFVLLAESEEQRKTIVDELTKNDIPSLIYYPNTLATLKALNYKDNNFDFSNVYAETNFGIPFSPYLTKEDQDKVIKVIIEAIERG